MKVVEREKATETLAAYTAEVGNGPVVVTDQGKPVAVLRFCAPQGLRQER